MKKITRDPKGFVNMVTEPVRVERKELPSPELFTLIRHIVHV